MNRSEWLLLALAAAEGQRLSPAQVQKSLFLLSRALPESERDQFYHFTPYHYGPFDAAIYGDAELLQAQGLASISRPLGCRWVEYGATPDGLARAEVARRAAPAELVEYLYRVVAWARSIPFQQLVRAIYAKYPEYRANSVFQD